MSNKSIPRRDLLKAAEMMPAMALLAGRQNNDGPKATPSGSPQGTGATQAAGSSAAITRTGSSTQWAAGGTDLMAADFPETAVFSTANTCTVDLTGAATEVPCYFHVDTGADTAQRPHWCSYATMRPTSQHKLRTTRRLYTLRCGTVTLVETTPATLRAVMTLAVSTLVFVPKTTLKRKQVTTCAGNKKQTLTGGSTLSLFSLVGMQDG